MKGTSMQTSLVALAVRPSPPIKAAVKAHIGNSWTFTLTESDRMDKYGQINNVTILVRMGKHLTNVEDSSKLKFFIAHIVLKS